MARTMSKLLAFTNGILMRKADRPVNHSRYLMSRGFAAARAASLEQQDDYHHQERPLERQLIGDKEEDRQSISAHDMNNWVPHPRSGIYVPQGQERVMDDVPESAASLGQGQTYWLRNIDGVEKHDPDVPSADCYLLN